MSSPARPAQVTTVLSTNPHSACMRNAIYLFLRSYNPTHSRNHYSQARLAPGVDSLVRGCARLGIATRFAATQYLGRLQSTLVRNSSQANTSGTTPKPGGEDGEKRPKPLRNPRNEAIPFNVVRLVDPETGALNPPQRLRDILPRVQRKTEYLELVVEKPEPIVKIINTKLQYGRKKVKRAQQVLNRAPEEKEMQLTWGVGVGDLQFKLKKARDELIDGNRVSIVFAPKKGQQLPSPEEQNQVVEETVRLLEDVGRERKARTVQKHVMALYMESLRPRKQVHELQWAYRGDESWVGLKAMETALRKGARVEAVFLLTPPPPNQAKWSPSDPSPDLLLPTRIPSPRDIQKQLDKTLGELAALGKEWRPRDTRKTAVVVYLEGIRVS